MNFHHQQHLRVLSGSPGPRSPEGGFLQQMQAAEQKVTAYRRITKLGGHYKHKPIVSSQMTTVV